MKSCSRIISCLVVLSVAAMAGCSAINPPNNYPSRDSIMSGETITVDGRKNVYAVAREHNVSMRDLIVLNNLQAPYVLKPGQKLTLPSVPSSSGVVAYTASSYGGGGPMAPAPVSASSGKVDAVPLAPIEQAPKSPATSFQPAQALHPVPSSQAGLQAQAAAVQSAPRPAAQGPVDALNAPRPSQKPVETTVASAHTDQPANVAPTPPAPPPDVKAPVSKLVWPVQGPILSDFGPKGQGLNNDGVNIGAPKGAPVVAAASGTVVYAGNEMKGFGNLILIRHPGGWVTAYAHLERMLVQKDSIVAQGDMIGTVGKTGNVPSPQLHFETRFQGKPVDPSSVVKAS